MYIVNPKYCTLQTWVRTRSEVKHSRPTKCAYSQLDIPTDQGRLKRRRRTRWTFWKTDSLQVQLAARLLIYLYSDDLRTTKVGAAAPGELPGELLDYDNRMIHSILTASTNNTAIH